MNSKTLKIGVNNIKRHKQLSLHMVAHKYRFSYFSVGPIANSLCVRACVRACLLLNSLQLQRGSVHPTDDINTQLQS